MEVNYQKMPAHLKERVFLYYKLYIFLEGRKILPDNIGNSFAEFLDMRYSDLFKHLFKKERNQKGLLLNEIKPIF